MSYNPWKITKDIIEDGKAIGTTSSCWEDNIECNDYTKIKFRLLDDDSNVYLEGVMRVMDFQPLDDFGISYGCTEIQYMENGCWKTL